MTDHTPAPTDKPGLDAETLAELRFELALAVRDYRGVWPEPYSLAPNLRLAVILDDALDAAEADRDAAVAERDALRERVTALADHWDDFAHDMVTCASYSCPDCTMKNAVHDLRTVLREADAPPTLADAEPAEGGGER